MTLNTTQFYLHGSPNRIPVGEEVLPATKVSTPEHIKSRDEANRDYRPDRIYMAPNPITALQYTWTDEDIEKRNPHPSGYIHVVEPIGKIMRDRSSRHAEIAGSRHARGARVVGSFPARVLTTETTVTPEEHKAYTDYMKRLLD